MTEFDDGEDISIPKASVPKGGTSTKIATSKPLGVFSIPTPTRAGASAKALPAKGTRTSKKGFKKRPAPEEDEGEEEEE